MEASSGTETIETMEREVASGATPPSLDWVWMWWSSGSCTYKASNMRKQQREGSDWNRNGTQHMSFLTLLLRSNPLFHSQQRDAAFVFKAVECLGEEVGSILRARDMRSANDLGADQISNEVPVNVDMFRFVVKDQIVR